MTAPPRTGAMRVVCKTVASQMAEIDVLETDTLVELKIKVERAIADLGGRVINVTPLLPGS